MPEVPGGQGIRTVMDTKIHPSVTRHLHFEFADWLGDDLIESFPVFLVSEKMFNSLIASNISGIKKNEDVEFSYADIFYDLNPEGKVIPNFVWIEVTTAPDADFRIDQNRYLNVSAEALRVLQSGRLNNCIIEIV